MAAHVHLKGSPEEYLGAERAAEIKSEFFDGHVYAMSGASFAQVLIAGNLAFALRRAVANRECLVVSNDLRLRVSPGGLYTSPDVVVVCGKPQFVDGQHDTLINPTLLIEVLSPSTEGYDRGFKSAQYRTIESLREYALVSQWEPRVELHRRVENGQWLISDFAGIDASGRLESIGCEMSLADVYQNVTFEDSAPR